MYHISCCFVKMCSLYAGNRGSATGLDFEELCASLETIGKNGSLTEEFRRLPSSSLFATTIGKTDASAKKNRWKNVVPYDHNRVILSQYDIAMIDNGTDYINASFIRGLRNEDGYIATQGPMLGTVDDFWSMVWSENNRLLVMMCRLVERCQNQSYKYWPDVGDCIDVDNITISTDMEDDRGPYVIRKFSLRHSKTGEVRDVTHLQFLAWPDNSLPCLPTFVHFWKIFRKFKVPCTGPPIIHCSDGSQHTGFLIALDSTFSQWESTNCVDLYSCVLRMREDRLGFFALESDYVYLYHALVEAYLSRSSYRSTNALWTPDRDLLNNGMLSDQLRKEILQEYQILDQRRPKASKNNACSNINGNMAQEILPWTTTQSCQLLFASDNESICVTCIPLLHQKRMNTCGERPSRLRHSVSLQESEIFLEISGAVPSDCKSSFLATSSTVSISSVEFWQIIFDTGCRAIVQLVESDEKTVLQADRWPLHSPDFSITMTSQKILKENFTETTMLMRPEIEPTAPFDCDMPSEYNVKIYTLEWQNAGHMVPSCDTLFLLYNRLSRWLSQTSTTLITVRFRDGCSTCGQFCAVFNALSSLETDQGVDIYLIARAIQNRLPQAVSQAEYLQLYSICEQFLQQQQQHNQQSSHVQSRDSAVSQEV